MKIHTWAWLSWILCCLLLISATRNPLYLLLINLLLLLVQIQTADQWNARFYFRFIFSILFLSTLFNIFLSHFGETILFTIPKQIPLISGAITAEAAVYGFTNGLVLIGMFSIFTILNQVLPVRALVGLIPHAFQPVAIVTTIAITFIPNTQKQFLAIKEAQALRGQRLTGIKDWLPLFIPLLIGGLERAMQVAEAMTARGFVSQAEKTNHKNRILMIISLVLIVVGWLLQLNKSQQILGWLLLMLGLLNFVIIFFFLGERSKRTRYMQENWNTTSSMTVLGSLLMASLFMFHLPGYASLKYSPYPLVDYPALGVIQLLAVCLIIFPIFFHQREKYAED